MEKNYKVPVIAWLKVTDYLQGWLQSELGAAAMVGEQRVVCVNHLEGVKKVMSMETTEGGTSTRPPLALSAQTYNCVATGLQIDHDETVAMYGIDRETLATYVPIEVPKMCMTQAGVLRPWTLKVSFGHQQAAALQKLLRDEFWKAVAEFDKQYAESLGGKRYPAVDMIEAFCKDTGTSDVYLDAMRREWQRRVKRANPAPQTSPSL